MIRIRYSAPSDLEISGSAADLETIRHGLLGLLVLPAQHEIQFEADTQCDPRPYMNVIPKLIIRKGQGPTRVTAENYSVQIAGSIDSLDAFASFLDFESTAIPGSHTHYEYYDDNPYISPDSVPLVIAIE
jgi:hypothetical protein